MVTQDVLLNMIRDDALARVCLLPMHENLLILVAIVTSEAVRHNMSLDVVLNLVILTFFAAVGLLVFALRSGALV